MSPAFCKSSRRQCKAKLAGGPAFSPIPVPELDRSALLVQSGWDQVQTIFPFQLYRVTVSGRQPLDAEQTQQVYCRLPFADIHCQLGQPVNYSAERNALRLCLSARLVVHALANKGENAGNIIAQALTALDQAAHLANLS